MNIKEEVLKLLREYNQIVSQITALPSKKYEFVTLNEESYCNGYNDCLAEVFEIIAKNMGENTL